MVCVKSLFHVALFGFIDLSLYVHQDPLETLSCARLNIRIRSETSDGSVFFLRK